MVVCSDMVVNPTGQMLKTYGGSCHDTGIDRV